MRLVKLRVRGFRRFAGLELDLDHPRLLVLGGNEAGKTSLMEALLAGLYGLAPQRRGAGHAAALRDVLPWGGAPAGLALQVRPAEGHLVEIDWDFSGERTRVIDHETGESISPDFATGTHGWRDVGAELVGLPGSVFRQLTCVGEGELARIVDPAEIRNSLLRIAESGVDEMVEAALRRLEDAALQASVPRVNSRTRRNALGAELKTSQVELERVARARAALDEEVETIAELERRLAEAESLVTGLRAGAAAEAEAERAAAEAEQARLRLAAAHSALAATRAEASRLRDRAARTREMAAAVDAEAAALAQAEAAGEAEAPPRVWTATELLEAQRVLASPIPPEPPPPSARAGWFLAVGGALALLLGLSTHAWPVSVAGLAGILVAVIVLTRRPIRVPEPVRVGDLAFADRAALMAEVDVQRVHAQARERAAALESRRGTLADRRALLASLLEGRTQEDWDGAAASASAAVEAAAQEAAGPEPEPPAGERQPKPGSAPKAPVGASRPKPGAISTAGSAATRLAEAEAHSRRLRDALTAARASLERGSRSVPEIAPLEERVAELEERIAALEVFGAAGALAAETLRQESLALRRAYAPRLQELLSRDLARVTGGRYAEALVSEDFRVQLRAPETAAMVELERLSRGTQQQVYLLLRLALLEIVGGGGREPLPLFLDDALALSDDARRGELLRIVEEQPRQVIYLTAGATAAEAFGPGWRRVELPPA